MSQPIQSCFERYEKKYFLTPAGQKALLQTIAPYIKMDFYGKYTICKVFCCAQRSRWCWASALPTAI